MGSFTLERWDDEGEKVTFYTVRKLGNIPEDDADDTEMDRFILKYENDPLHFDSLNKLIQLIIEVMGNEYGAVSIFFTRPYNNLHELPPRPGFAHFEIGLNWREFPLRIFCLRISEELVVLFNGGEKTSQKTQDSPSWSLKAREAEGFARRIAQAFDNDEIAVDGRNIISNYGDEPIVID